MKCGFLMKNKEAIAVYHFIPGDGPNALIESISTTLKFQVKILTLYDLDKTVPSYCLANNVEISSLGFQEKSLVRQFLKFGQFLQKEKPKLVFAHSFYPSLLCAIARIFFWKTIFVPVRHHNRVHIMSANSKAILLDKIITKFTQHTVAVSDSVRETMIQEGSRKEKISVIYNGLPRPRGTYSVDRPVEVNRTYNLIALGRIDWQKNYESMLRIIWKLRMDGLSVQLHILGGGNLEYLEQLKGLQDELGLSGCVFWLGRQFDIYSFLDESDLFLHTALDEACPLVLIETLMYGIPIASSNLGGCKDVLRGFYDGCDPGDIEKFCQMLSHTLGNLKDSRAYAQSISSEAIDKFSPLLMQQRYSELSLKFLNNRKVC